MCDTGVVFSALLVARQCSRTLLGVPIRIALPSFPLAKGNKWMCVTKAFSCCHSDHGHEKILIPSHVTHTGERDVKILTDLAAMS